MPKHLSVLAAAVGVGLAVIVTVSGFRTSSARFAASTENRSNLWEAAEITMSVGEDRVGATGLFLDGSGLHTGSEVMNCILIDVESSTERPRVQLHGEILADDGLAQFFDVRIERGRIGAGCENFTVDAELYRGTLLDLATERGSFEAGVSIIPIGPGPTPYRFTGWIQDTNDAQGKSLEYIVHLETRP